MDLSILIVSFNTRELTLGCLRSIYEQTSAIDFEVIVVENASQDGSADAIAQAFPQVRLIKLDRNLGFAGATNLAASKAKGQLLLLLNPDTVILDRAIEKAVAFARSKPSAGIVGGRTRFEDGSLNYNSCHGRPTLWSVLCLGTGLASLFRRSRVFNPESLGRWQRDSVREVDAVTGCFLLIGSPLWKQLNGLDESFFMYGEDTDLCLRAWQLGKSCVICPSATLIHYGAASDRVRPEKMIRLFRAKGQLFRKHWNPAAVRLGIWSLKLWAFSRMTALGVLKTVDRRRQTAFDAWKEIWRRRDEFAGRNGDLPQPHVSG